MLEEFENQGFFVLKGTLLASACDAMCDSIWLSLKKQFDIDKVDSSTWVVDQPRGLGHLRKQGVFSELGNATVVRTIDELLGPDSWDKPRQWGGPLVTFPTLGKWSYPSSGWHIDYPVRGNLDFPFAVKVLGLLADIEPGGGATLLSRGSHLQVRDLAAKSAKGNAGSSSEVRKKLEAKGVKLQDDVFEFVGEKGDVLFFDPWLFHCASKNVRQTPRLMVEQNLPTRKALSLYSNK